MSLMRRLSDDRDREFRTQAALHGREVVDASSPGGVRSGLRSFHDRMSRKLRGR